MPERLSPSQLRERALPIAIFLTGLPIGLVVFGVAGHWLAEPVALTTLPAYQPGSDPTVHRLLGLTTSIVPFTLLCLLIAVSVRARSPLSRRLSAGSSTVLTLALASNALWLLPGHGSNAARSVARFGSAYLRVQAFQMGMGAGLLGIFTALALFGGGVLVQDRSARARGSRRPTDRGFQVGFVLAMLLGWILALLLVLLR
ncbi:hypothetical protein GCM10009841_00870 [Microlunatus panaciterrae]|uniref:DUF998 domain-containing protein n=1 Tax=Microlunatus panaciterrae TaxID=400768 RepID=A0ABS2RJH7_9ACTN|nr:hypothetical protein [Microlunatus panaciterrae]MBM7799169.1 hypothetical protein [Microlunatus panaciterrae]